MREAPFSWNERRIGMMEGMREGRRAELDAFGAVRKTADFDYVARQLADKRGYVTFRQGMDLVRSYTRQDATNPEKLFAKELRQEVCELLHLPIEAWDSVRFYTAIDTPLDRFHKTDGWIEYIDPKNSARAFITLDVTLNASKFDDWVSAQDAQEDYRGANVVIMNPADPSDDHFDKQIGEYARLIASQLSAKIHQMGLRRPIPFPNAARRAHVIAPKNRPSR